MESAAHRENEPNWTAAEKKVARRAFDKAFERNCAAIYAETRQMLKNTSAPTEIWRVQEYLYEQRRIIDRIYDYRYSMLLFVFARLLRDGWLTEVDLAGLHSDKIASIKAIASV